jgi:hypothetical protein
METSNRELQSQSGRPHLLPLGDIEHPASYPLTRESKYARLCRSLTMVYHAGYKLAPENVNQAILEEKKEFRVG